ncbi:hypothetical protein TRVL_04152 [Trypanosoma vivax]|nr:hypothetical protein TRVL_04152 [Trypanosoma vivax]
MPQRLLTYHRMARIAACVPWPPIRSSVSKCLCLVLNLSLLTTPVPFCSSPNKCCIATRPRFAVAVTCVAVSFTCLFFPAVGARVAKGAAVSFLRLRAGVYTKLGGPPRLRLLCSVRHGLSTLGACFFFVLLTCG